MKRTQLDLHLLNIFILTARQKSIKTVAGMLGISTSAVSLGLKALEESLGVTLFDRESRPMRMTEAGRKLHEEGEALLKAANALQARVGSKKLEVRTFRLGLGESITSTLSPWLLKGIYEKVNELYVTSGMSAPLIAALKENKLDLVLCADSGWQAEDLDRREIYREEYLLITSKDAPEIHSPADLQRLSEYSPFIGYNTGSSDDIEIRRILRTLSLSPVHTVRVGASYTLVGLVDLLKGWTIQPATNFWCGRQFIKNLRFTSLPTAGTFERKMLCIGDALTQGEKMDLVCGELKKAVQSHLLLELSLTAPGLEKFVELAD